MHTMRGKNYQVGAEFVDELSSQRSGLGLILVSDSRCDSASSNRLIAVNRRKKIMSIRIRPVITGNQLQS